ncbi:hypothetical protein CVU76_00535 [Candidatus Dojkabacteria bacterium HGW-Dojkabacteria-1]|uniref:Uncharacterized protein n=1 Tax=Candidatus Dojkabacteria bacterium HGW-Dojkabacteria-1 TaxID=2013761 RepID=A0A2N2F2Z3_9BACT|nr:MAG: hypothetical protein CVU76_00535 [Candidatus Dojkabacteria bacterium HGW-Dojkabacteria-1]
MRQHPIPQNVLDVEFKLFTRFTLKEFAYLALGVGTGGIFLYLSIGGDIPGIIGIPLFAILSGIGAFLALVPINDQPADKAIINYFTAINRPTQRVWLNQTLKEQRIKPTVTAIDDTKRKVIGTTELREEQKSQIFEENPGDDILAIEGEETKEVTKDVVQQEEKILLPDDEYITISEENISKYQFPIKSIDKLPGNINIWLCTKDNQPLSNVNTYLKDSNGKILYANKTGPNGYFLSNRIYPEGIYIIEFEGLASSAPKLRILVTKNQNKLPLKIALK